MTYPPSRLGLLVKTPNGRYFRWASDEARPENAAADLSFSTTIPGGFEELSCVLTRKPEVGYADLDPLSDVKVLGAGGETVAQYRLESAPRASGEQIAIEPTAVGWQAALEDNGSCSQVFVDRDLSSWQVASATRKEAIYTDTANYDKAQDFDLVNDATGGTPELRLNATPPWATGLAAEAWYDAGPGNTVSRLYFDYIGRNLAAGWVGGAFSYSSDTGGGAVAGTDVVAGATPTGTQTETWGTPQRYNALALRLAAGTAGDNKVKYLRNRQVSVWGNHGLTRQGLAPNDGLFASDVIAYTVRTFVPSLNVTTGGRYPSVQDTGFIVPQLAFREGTTPLEMIQGADRFHHWDWAVWDGQSGPTFYYYPPGGYGKKWRTRVGPSKLQRTGRDVSRVWNGVIVRYQDVDGQTLSVGPTGSQATSTSASLLDSDPTNPANQAGLTRYAVFEMNGVSTLAGATQVGVLLLAQYKLLDQSGSASLTGWVEDSAGRLFPVSRVRAGDYIAFMDAADTSYRRIVRTSYEHATVTNQIDLGAPPEGLDALLERLQVSIVSLGL